MKNNENAKPCWNCRDLGRCPKCDKLKFNGCNKIQKCLSNIEIAKALKICERAYYRHLNSKIKRISDKKRLRALGFAAFEEINENGKIILTVYKDRKDRRKWKY